MNITLYAAPMSSATPVINALEELEVPYELVLIDLASRDQRKADFLAQNPNGRVPTLVVDGVPMFEALAIMQWLGDRFGVDRGMWPAADASGRLEALSWSTWSYVTFGATFQRLNFASSERVDSALHHEAQAEHARKELQDLLAILDRRLHARDYLLGDDFTLVDLIVGNVITYAAFVGVPSTGHDHVEAWLARFHARPAYKKAWAVPS